jgi:5-methylcytosine-specific restriction endonuclease McrA
MGKASALSSRTGQRWPRLRRAYLAKNPVCECGCGLPSVLVRHRRPHDGDPDLFYAWDNLVAVARDCPNAAREQ